MGVTKTLAHLQENFFWKGMHEDVKNFIAQCINFQSTKYETKRQTSLLQPSPVPTTIWETFPSTSSQIFLHPMEIQLFLLLLTIFLRQLILAVFRATSRLSRLLSYSLHWSANTIGYPVAWSLTTTLSLLANFGVNSSSLAAPNFA